MDNINLRSARVAEYPLIRKLITQNNLNPFELKWDSFIVAADEADQFVGCGQIKRHGELEELASLVVVEAWQGRGVSHILMQALMARGKRPLWLMCESPLTNYYNKFGFREVEQPSQLPVYFRNLYWFMRLSFGLVFLARGKYVAFMVLDS